MYKKSLFNIILRRKLNIFWVTILLLICIPLSTSAQVDRDLGDGITRANFLGVPRVDLIEIISRVNYVSKLEENVTDGGMPFVSYEYKKQGKNPISMIYYFNKDKCSTYRVIYYVEDSSKLLEDLRSTGFVFIEKYWINGDTKVAATIKKNKFYAVVEYQSYGDE